MTNELQELLIERVKAECERENPKTVAAMRR